MNEEMSEFEKSVNYLTRLVPPDDIYMFSQQILLMIGILLNKIIDGYDSNKQFLEDMQKDENLYKIFYNYNLYVKNYMDNTLFEINLDFEES